ncbi:tetratricopeptide repeat protein [Microvirga sesbaniae]|uniref:tetratricopeptide repeat protein n=1 Tax=Microvirga sesbaniae TaxID=681392 RepID=UPI0021C67000|nr:tetratricopeptide repeat protein [Microvirga sp. HBU67692]
MAPNDEFIREVDEEYRRDRIAQIWNRYNGIIIAVVVLIVAGVGGWRFWQHTQEQRAQEAAVRYEEALRLSSEDKGQESQAAFETVVKEDGATGYAMLARFRLAAELGQQNAENGASAFDALANDGSVPPLWKDLARLRAAWLRIDTAEPARLRQAVEPLAAPSNAWRHSARELLGLSGLKAGDMDYAGRWFDQIAADRETPSSLRQRLAVYTALVAGGPVQATQ